MPSALVIRSPASARSTGRLADLPASTARRSGKSRPGVDSATSFSGGSSKSGQLYAYARELATGDEWEADMTDDLGQLQPKLDAIAG